MLKQPRSGYDRRLLCKSLTDTTDGVKVNFEEGWVHLRPSNTEPIVRSQNWLESACFAKRIKDQITAGYGIILLVLWAFLETIRQKTIRLYAGLSVYSSEKVTNCLLQTQLPTRLSRIHQPVRLCNNRIGYTGRMYYYIS